jgi:transcriptional regulator with XRE-family HTH domain
LVVLANSGNTPMTHRAADGTRGMSDFGRELTRLMAERGVGVRQLARAAYVNPSHISNLRSGKARPSPELAALLDQKLGCGGALITAAQLESGRSAVALQSAHSLESGTQPWALADTLTRSSLSITALDFMEEAVTSLAARYPFTPPVDLIPGVQAMLNAVNGALGESQPLAVRARCVGLAGILCGVVGQIADDMGRPDKSAAWFSAGAVAAAETADRDLTAWLLALRAIGCHFRGEYVPAAGFLDRAVESAASCTPRRRAWLATLSARAQAAVAARRDGRADGVRQAIEAARGYLDAADAPSDTDFFDGPRLAGIAGTAMLLVKDVRAARSLIGEALDGRAAGDVKGRALLTLDLADCAAADGEPEEAARLAAKAIGISGGDNVMPVVTRATAVHGALQPWAQTRAVRELGGRVAAAQISKTEG